MSSSDSVTQSSPYEILLGEVDRVIGEWRHLVSDEPWKGLPPSELVDSLPEILPRIFRLARAGETHMDADLRECVAQTHGLLRRKSALPLRAVADEWNYVRRACWKVLRRNDLPEPLALEALSRLDLLIDDAIGYTLRGYYTVELDALRGRGLERRLSQGDRRTGNDDRRDR